MMSSDFECMLREVSVAEVTVLFGDPWWGMGFISLWVAKIANTIQQDHELFWNGGRTDTLFKFQKCLKQQFDMIAEEEGSSERDG